MGNPLGDPDMRVSFSTLQRRVKELERRRTPGRPAAPPRTLAELEDVDVTGVADAEVLTYDGTLEKWVRGDAGLTHPNLGATSDDGTFGVSTTALAFEFEDEIIVPPFSLVAVEISAVVVSGCFVEVNSSPSITLAAPWYLEAYDSTADSIAAYLVGSTGVGPSLAHCTVLCANDTDAAVARSIYSRVNPVDVSWDYTADVTVTFRYGYFTA